MAGTSFSPSDDLIYDAEGNAYPDTNAGRAALKKARETRIKEALANALKNPKFDLELDNRFER